MFVGYECGGDILERGSFSGVWAQDGSVYR